MKNQNNKALLMFQIGPVQPFIEAAKTVRDLWSGSYLLSWLVVAAMKKACDLDLGAGILSPAIKGNPILDLFHGRFPQYDVLTPCLPNHFEVSVESDISEEVVTAARTEWKSITTAVKNRLTPTFRQGCTDCAWDRDWDAQIDHFFEMRCVFLPPGPGTDEERLDRLHALMAAVRNVRYTPRYEPTPDNYGRFGMKCTLLGTFEQVGPAETGASREYWHGLAGWGFDGTVLRERERLCAVSLVKRFAWPTYLSARTGKKSSELRYEDSATVAARQWLQTAGIRPNQVRSQHGTWSGQWLHRVTPEPRETDDKEDRCPPQVWNRIRLAKSPENPVPAYYAILMMDGDRLGDLIRSKGVADVSGRLTDFALKHVPKIVEVDHQGELIYAGGDDVLAMLPTVTAFDAARRLNETYCKDVMAGIDGATVSAGLIVAHYKEDIRFALRQAREAEREAKNAGRDCVCLRILRRSGEHTSAVLPWSLVEAMQQLVKDYIGQSKLSAPSDRWAYQLRALLPTLAGSVQMFEAELRRQLGRLEMPEESRKQFTQRIQSLLVEYRSGIRRRNSLANDADIHTQFIGLCQAASFLARGRDQ